MKVEILAIGSELLTPFRLDTNSLYLTGRLEELGLTVARKTVVGDALPDLTAAFRESAARSSLVIAIGGLGPTEDDRTRDAVASALNLPLAHNRDAETWLRDRFKKYKRRMPEINLKQAQVPQGGEWFPNEHGTAPALWIETSGGKTIVLLPGPPRELEPLFEEFFLPRIRKLAPKNHIATRVFKVAGLGEGQLEELIAPIYTKVENPQTTILSSPGQVEVHLRAEGKDTAKARRIADELGDQIESALGDNVFSRGHESLEQVTGFYLTMRGATLAVAESCTGGLLGQRLTAVAGSSRYFLGGVVCYGDESKKKLLKVPAALLSKHGAVSAEVAASMAENARKVFGARIGVGITGIAGPDGGTPDKPIGTVFIALSGTRSDKPKSFLFHGERERVRWLASQTALDLLRRQLLK